MAALVNLIFDHGACFLSYSPDFCFNWSVSYSQFSLYIFFMGILINTYLLHDHPIDDKR